MTPVLRDYQLRAIAQLREQFRAGKRRVVLIMPTGGGKTICAASMIHSALARGNRSLFLAHRRELIDQTVDKLLSYGVNPGVIMASDSRRDDLLPVQVASIQTLVRRLDKKPPANLVVVDECHHATSETYKKVMAAYDNAIIIGLTATPWRSDRVGLADIYETSVLACTPAELMTIGALVPYDVFAYDAPDLHQVRVTAGDFNQKDLAVACNTKVIVGSIVQEYMAHAPGRRAIVFPVNIEHSKTLVEGFRATGITAEHVDCDTPTTIRTSAMERFRHGNLIIISSVGVLTEGFDAPAAEVCILARPTKSLPLYLQMVGRVLRLSRETGKTRALIHDHSGNTLRHGFCDDARDYALGATPERVVALHTCPACFQVFSTTKAGRCPHCHELITVVDERASRGERLGHEVIDGQRISRAEIEKIRDRRSDLGLMRELADHQIARAAVASREQKAAEYLRLKNVAETKGFKPGFAAHQYREVFGVWPRFTDDDLMDVQPALKPFFPLERKRG